MCKKLLSLALICFANTAVAQGNWTIGVLAVDATDVYTGGQDAPSFAPIISYDTEKLHIGFDGVSYQVYDYGFGQIDVGVAYRAAPGFPDKSALFNGLKRKDAVELAVGTQLEFGNLYVGLDALTDVTGVHKGTEADATIGYVMQAGQFQIDAAIGARYRTAELNQYLFGVAPGEVTDARSAFKADATTTGFANLTIGYPITDSVTAVAQFSIEETGKNKDSPLVSRSSAVGVGLGVAWTF